MSKIIGISGRIGSGKDTIADMIKEITGVDYEIKKFAGKLKLIASILLGYPIEKFEDREFKDCILGNEWSTPIDTGLEEAFPGVTFLKTMDVREFLQKLGTDAMRNGLHTNVWLNALWSDLEQDSNWLITDTRFTNEADSVKERGGVVVRLTRNDGVEASHVSETVLDDYNFDYVIDNKGKTLEETYVLVEEFLTKI